MNTEPHLKLSTAQVKQRLIKIVDHHFERLASLELRAKQQHLVLNESLLEEWNDLLAKMVYFKDTKKVPQVPVKMSGNLKKQHDIPKIKCLPPLPSDRKHNVLLSIVSNQIDVLQILQKEEKKEGSYFIESSRMVFDKGMVHRYCSYTCCDSQNIVLIGGYKDFDPSMKSHSISNLNLISREIVKLADMPYGISSHGAVKVNNRIYIVGGNKNFNIVTKNCLQFDLQTHKVSGMGQLNYPSASHTLLNWKDRFVYKFGGIGSCFGEWDLSPYIQRYGIVQNEWQTINPTINVDQDLLHHYSLLINSLVYVSSRNSIVILGGFDFQQKASGKMFEIQVKEQIRGQITEYSHDIVSKMTFMKVWARLIPSGQQAFFPKKQWLSAAICLRLGFQDGPRAVQNREWSKYPKKQLIFDCDGSDDSLLIKD